MKNERDIIVEVRQIISEQKPPKKQIDYYKIWELALKFLWLLFVITIFCKFYPQIKYDILPNVSSFNVAGFGVTMKEDLSIMSKLALNQNKNGEYFEKYISPIQQDLIFSRASKLYKKLNHTRILWVDINIDSNRHLREILKKWGATIDCSLSDNEAYTYLNNSKIDSVFYDLVITNHSNNTHVLDGTSFAKEAINIVDIPIILFSASRGNQDSVKKYGIPDNIFAATNRYDHLFHFIFDALERGNTPYPANLQRYLASE